MIKRFPKDTAILAKIIALTQYLEDRIEIFKKLTPPERKAWLTKDPNIKKIISLSRLIDEFRR
jgi:hypothetical protein